MNGTIPFTQAALVKLLDDMLYPNPDDPGPYGPIGPIIRWALSDLSWVLLNPQPLPPVAGPGPQPWYFGPVPDPWRSAFLARTVIDRAVAHYQFAEASAGREQLERTTATIGAQLREFVDDYCGTRPPRWPRPWPWPPHFDAAQLRALDLLVAGAQFHKAADVAPDSPLHAEFSAAAEQLFEAGLRRLENR
jgi:hypothetical protein